MSCHHKTSRSQLDNKSETGAPILHAEALFISAETGFHQWILSRTSLKGCIHFGFIPKLTMFTCQQLKRHATFGAVQDHSLDLQQFLRTIGVTKSQVACRSQPREHNALCRRSGHSSHIVHGHANALVSKSFVSNVSKARNGQSP